MKVREYLPSRRKSPSRKPTGENWSDHKPDLKEDFHSHCAYCGSYDGFRHTYFEVDHFVPKSLFRQVGGITDCQYDNLVYSCKFCNNKKGSEWPSGNIGTSNVDNKGFIDPCSSEYEDHVYRTPDGSILGNTELGKWMVKFGFKFDERDYGIRLLWNLNEVKKSVEALKIILGTYPEGTDEYKTIRAKTMGFTELYFQQHQELIEYYDNL